jgi:hypothetical protein
MKYIISERQYFFLTEQSAIGLGPATAKVDPKEFDPHTRNTILQLSTAFIPYVGPYISAGIGLSDAKMYYDEGDKRMAGIVGLFSMIPGIGGLASKLGLGNIASKTLAEIGKKIGTGAKLTPAEIQIAQKVAQNAKVIQQSMNQKAKEVTKGFVAQNATAAATTNM